MVDRSDGPAAGRPQDRIASPRRQAGPRLATSRTATLPRAHRSRMGGWPPLAAVALVVSLATPAAPVAQAAAPFSPPATAAAGAATVAEATVAVEAAGAGQARLSRADVPARGRQEAILGVERFGRYSVRAASRQGTAVKVVDRMAGEIGAAGEAGHENGRLDLFLDRGEYLVVAESHEHGEGAAKLSVEPFHDAHEPRGGTAPAAAATPELVERKLVAESLDDLRQLSYWLRLAERREVRLETAGRNLADLRLWRDGSWLEDVEPSCAAIQPVTGQPLMRCEVAATLQAGLYLVTIYGGASQPWAEDAAEHPLYLRWGYPRLADAGRRRYQVGPFGEDRFELPDNVNYVRIELPQARPAQLTAGWAQAGQLLSALGGADAATAEVKKNSVPPVAVVRVPAKPAAANEAHRRGGAAGEAAPARPTVPSIADERPPAGDGGDDAASGPAGDGGAGQAGAEGGAGNDAGETLSNAGAAAVPGGAGAADEGAADETMQESAPGAAMAEGAAAAAPPSPSGGGEETADRQEMPGDESAAGPPEAVQPARDETSPQAERGGETGGEEEAAATEAGGQAAGDAGAAAGPAGPRLWVSVRGTPGQVYVLQHFEQKTEYTFHDAGLYWISTVHSGDPRDSVDATAILTSHPARGSTGDSRERLEKSAAVAIDGQHAWARRFNLLGPLELFVEIGDQGAYETLCDEQRVPRLATGGRGSDGRQSRHSLLVGAAATGGGQVRLEPYLTSRPENYKAPSFRRCGARWDLDGGLYVLTAVPLRRGGIVTLGVRPAGKFGKLLEEAAAPGAGRDPVRASSRLAPTLLDPAREYTLTLNRQPGVDAGLVLRSWPVDLGQPLPVTQRPGEPLQLEFTSAAAGTLRAEAEDGRLLEAMVDGGPWQTAAEVAPGAHKLQVRDPGEAAEAQTVSYSLWVEPRELAAAAPLPPLPAAALAALPRFPVLRPGAPRFIDLVRGESAAFLVQADQPALYQLQTTGVLATSAALRTRTVTSLAAGSANGVGRNALVRQYLRQGDFQATVTAEGRSQGHLGVELLATPLLDGGELRLAAPARITLPAGQGVVYRFTLAEAGDYHLLAMGLGFVYSCRLEDAAGWPIATPGIAADLSRKLPPGSYRLVLLPQPIAGRAVTLLSRRQEPPRLPGHGPHPLPLDTAVEHVWQEPAGADGAPDDTPAQRPPDLWRFDLPAAATATITLDAEMQGTLTRLGTGGAGAAAADAAPAAELGQVPPGRGLTLELAAGHYQLAVVCSRRNSLVRYRVRVATAELVDGEEPLLSAPATLDVSVGGGGLVEIASYSASDVRARLYAADGSLVADEDDRPDDWNFLISERLAAGRYRLEIEPVGSRRAKVRVSMRTAPEVADKPLALPHAGDVALAGEVRLLPLVVPSQANLLLVAARSQENLGLGLEVRQGDAWRRVGSSTGREPRLEVALNAAGSYRLRLWSLERRGSPVRLTAAAVTAPHIREGQLAKGAALPLVPRLEPPLGPLAAAVVELDRPGLVRLRLAASAERSGKTRQASPTGGGAAGADEAGADDAGAGWRGGSVSGQVLAPLPAIGAVTMSGLGASGGRIWLVAAAPRGAPHLRGERLALGSGLDRAVAFHLPAASTAAPPASSVPAPPTPMAPTAQLPPPIISCDLDRGRGTAAAGPVLALVTALAGQPAARDADAASPGASGPPGSRGAGGAGGAGAPGTGAAATLAIGPRSAVSVALAPRRPSAQVWDAEPAPPGAAAPPEVRLAQLSFPAPRRETASFGVAGGSLNGFEAREFELPPGAKKVRLSLGAATVAVLSDGDVADSTHWQGGLPFEELLASGATRLTLLHTQGGSDPFTFEVLPRAAGETELALAPATPFVRAFDRAGTLRLRLPDAATAAAGTGGGTRRYRVWIAAQPAGGGTPGGAAGPQAEAPAAALLDGAGGVQRGAEVTGAPGGWLLIPHGPGLVVAWTAGVLSPGEERPAGSGGWQAPLAAAAQAVTPPATVPLAGRFTHLALASREPAVLHVRAAAPALTLLARAGGGETAAIHPAGVRLDAYLPAGESHLGFGVLGEGELGGFAELTTTPVTPTAEGLGPEILLPPGDTRYFSFHLAARRLVGWGAGAAAEGVSCRLLHGDSSAVTARAPAVAEAAIGAKAPRPKGTGAPSASSGSAPSASSGSAPWAPAGSGPALAALADMLQMAELEAGDYLLALTAPPDAPPLRVRPVVVGLELPDTGPPPEVIRQYLQQAGAAVPAAASGASNEP